MYKANIQSKSASTRVEMSRLHEYLLEHNVSGETKSIYVKGNVGLMVMEIPFPDFEVVTLTVLMKKNEGTTEIVAVVSGDKSSLPWKSEQVYEKFAEAITSEYCTAV